MSAESSPRHILVVSSLIRNAEGKVLLIRHHKRGWEIPQGRVEEGEGLLVAAHREILEETGVEVELGPLAVVWSKVSAPTAVIFTFFADYRAGELSPSEETPELDWFPPEEALLRVTHPVNHDRLKALLQQTGSTRFCAYTTSPYRVLPD